MANHTHRGLMSSGTELLGAVLQDRYKVEKLIARGGMAWVYRASHIHFNVPVAIKVLYPHLAEKKSVRRRFLEEARIQFKIHHPNLVRVTDILEMEYLLGMVQEWVEGPDLKAWMEKGTQFLDLPTMAEILLPVFEGLGEAHRHGVIHRDLKPANILLSFQNGRIVPKVTDFGIAKVFESKEKTVAGSSIGTAEFMSPEQIRDSKTIDSRSDVYSLGVIMYWLATRQLPFQDKDSNSLLQAHIKREPVAPGQINPAIDSHFEELIMRCLKKLPQQRPQNCEELHLRLQGILSGEASLSSVEESGRQSQGAVAILENSQPVKREERVSGPLTMIEEELVSTHQKGRKSKGHNPSVTPNLPTTPVPQEDAGLSDLEKLLFDDQSMEEVSQTNHPLTRTSPKNLPFDDEVDLSRLEPAQPSAPKNPLARASSDAAQEAPSPVATPEPAPPQAAPVAQAPNPNMASSISIQSHAPQMGGRNPAMGSTLAFHSPYAQEVHPAQMQQHISQPPQQHISQPPQQHISQPPHPVQPMHQSPGGTLSFHSPYAGQPHPVQMAPQMAPHMAPQMMQGQVHPSQVQHISSPPQQHMHPTMAGPGGTLSFHSPYAGQPQPGQVVMHPSASQSFVSPYAGQPVPHGAPGTKSPNMSASQSFVSPYANQPIVTTLSKKNPPATPPKHNPLAGEKNPKKKKKGLSAFQILVVIPALVLLPLAAAAGFFYYLQQQVKPAAKIHVRNSGNLDSLGFQPNPRELSDFTKRERYRKRLDKSYRSLYAKYQKAVAKNKLSRKRIRYFEKHIWSRYRSSKHSLRSKHRVLRRASWYLKKWVR